MIGGFGTFFVPDGDFVLGGAPGVYHSVQMNTGLADLFSLPLNTPLSLIVLPLLEVYPAKPAPGGHQQEIRVKNPGGGLFNVFLYEQINVPTGLEGGVLRVSASPEARRPPIRWERLKSQPPSSRIGTLVIRKEAFIEMFSKGEAALAGEHGFRVLVPSIYSAPAVDRPIVRHAPEPVRHVETARLEAPSVPVVPGPEKLDLSASIMEETRRFAECIRAARAALGADADPADIRETARMTYERLFPAVNGHKGRLVTTADAAR